MDGVHFENWVELKPEFVKRYTDLLGEDGFKEFNDFSNRYIQKSIRVNTLKISVKDLKKRLEADWDLKEVPWCSESFWINYKHGKRYDIGNLPEHQLGYIYVQDAASMLPPVVLNPEPESLVLDMCAAPGSKTSQVASYMNNTGLIVANDFQGKRLSSLGINLQRCGVHNTIITRMDGNRIKKQGDGFDFIMVDAPCSGTGTLRRNPKIASMWSPGLVKRMASTQKQLLFRAFDILRPGGILVYSTCTLEPEENEAIVSCLLEQYSSAKLLDIDLNIKRSPVITEFDGIKYNSEVKKCLRICPQDNDSEGFFVAKIRKTP
ncbi:RsmB/NOP family class I SAM-dependent RNA methyltransferase [Candidatus Woesearchaeota archaeon]|nr:RsmB/NOP family class I SAM-dependent RNA methyltransferase [Candidatus Woesearchaeota archaeon]MCF7901588.1 RsmB/NOP family class I SAM-dependent RNA methyltransferase [Candidatus Woesearchaeota archaeon]MCF8013647.1 RsmB/NOP family class I SAM-dependent RNA methyltransferase [Candidatus Woesearchaeota archaeon]